MQGGASVGGSSGVGVDPATVIAQGRQVAGSGLPLSAVNGGPIRPAARDPVSAAAAASLSVCKAVISDYSGAASEIIKVRGAMLQTSGAAYADQEAANQAGSAIRACRISVRKRLMSRWRWLS